MDSSQPPAPWGRLPLALSLVGFAAIAWPLLHGKVYAHTDLRFFYLPLVAFYAERLYAGESFDWCPLLYHGFYLQGEGQLGMYHPWHWAIYRTFDLQTAFALQQIAPFVVVWLGMRTWLRRWMSLPAAETAGAYFAFSAFFLRHSVHLNAVEIVAHLPWLVWAAESTVNRPTLSKVAWVGIAIGSQVLLGYPQYVMLSVGAASLWLLLSLPTAANPWRSLGVWSSGAILGAVIGAVQLLPTVEALGDSTRGSVTSEFRASYSIHPLNALQLFSSTAFASGYYAADEHANGHETAVYPGVAVVLAVLWASVAGPAPGIARLTYRAWALVLFGAILALGSYGWLFPLLANLPAIGSFRAPCRFSLWAFVGGAALLGAAVERLLGDRVASPNDRRWPWMLGSAAIVYASLSAYLAIALPHAAGDRMDQIWGAVLFVLAAAALELARRGSRFAVALLLAFVILDPLAYGLKYQYFVGDEPRSLSELRTGAYSPNGPPRGRVVGDVGNNQFLLKGWSSATGYLGLPPKRVLDFRESRAAQQLANVTHVWSPTESRWRSTDVQEAAPDFFLVAHALQADDVAKALDSVDPLRTAIVDRPIRMASETVGEASPIARAPGRWRIRCSTKEPQMLVVRDGYHRGWRAVVDGKPVSVWRVNGDFLGLPVPAGEHVCEFEFDPDSLRHGKLLSVIGVFVALGLLVAPRRVGRLGSG